MNDKYKFDSVSFGIRLSKIRKFHKKTQDQIAEYLDVSTKTVQNWEHGAKMPGIDNIVSLAEYFNMSIGEILEDEAYRIFEKKLCSRKRSIEIIPVESKIELFMEFCEDRYMDRYELLVWDEAAKYKYLYVSVKKLIPYTDFKKSLIEQSDVIADTYRKWLFSILTTSEEDVSIKKIIEDKIICENKGMASKGAVWGDFGYIIYFDDDE